MLKIKSYSRIKGYLPQRFQPTTFIFVESTLNQTPINTIKKFNDDILLVLTSNKLNKKFSLLDMVSSDLLISQEDTLKKITLLAQATLEACGFPKFEIFIKLFSNENEKYIFRIMAEELVDNPSNIVKIFSNLISIVNSLLLNNNDYETKINSYKNLFKFLEKNAPQGVNTLKFIEAAKDLDIPCRKMIGNVFQFGWGSKSRWLNSSFTDQTSNIASMIARDKLACSHLLRAAGFPVPKNFKVTSVLQSVTLANKLGYPVVIKVSNLDGGLGVYSKLQDDYSVTEAYEKAKKISNHIIIEEYIFGKDYRIQVCRNEVYRIVERQGPRVMGDGRHSIKELIHIFNTDRSDKNLNSDSILPLIIIDDDLEDYLSSQKLMLNDIPNLGNVTELRAANNVNGGGSFYPVSLEEVHPDNINLAIRISKTIRLDILGIDFLISDIGISWKETKCGICEINAQPQISGDKHKYVLQKILMSDGRIPSILSLGRVNDLNIYEKALNFLSYKDLNLGFATSEGAWINHNKILEGYSDINQTGIPLTLDPSVDFLLFEIDLNIQGPPIFPVDRVDTIFLPQNLSALLKIPQTANWLKEVFKLSKNLISFVGEAELISGALKLPKEKFKNSNYDNIEAIFNQIIKK